MIGGNFCVDNSTSPSSYRTMKKSVCPVKTNYTEKLKENQNNTSYILSRMNSQFKIDVLTADLHRKQSRKRPRSVPNKNEINYLPNAIERKGKSTGKYKKKLVMKHIQNVDAKNASPLVNDTFFSDNNTENKKSPVKIHYSIRQNEYLTPIGYLNSNLGIKEDCLTADLLKVKRRRANTVPSKTTELNDGELLSKRRTSTAYQKRRLIKPITSITFTQNENESANSICPNTVMKELPQLPIDNLRCNDSAAFQLCYDEGLVVSKFGPQGGKKKILSWPLGNGLSSKISGKDDFSNMPLKGTLKHKRWLLNNLKETNAGYEDDLFENHISGLYKTAFHFGDESDGSSVNIATPKFDCVLTPSLPNKTPRFKDCISPTELLQARKTAEEYLYRRNKKRTSKDKPSSSGKKTSMNKKNTTKDIPEKKKLDFEEAVNKLIAVQKDLEKNAEVDDEEEDSYFSDGSN